MGAHVRSEDGRAHGDQVRGLRQISYALEDVLRATEEGIRSFLVADLGLLRAVTQAQAQGALPPGLVWKVSAAMSPSNPVTVKLLEDLGASTVNIPADATLAELAEMRAAVSIPLDLYVEAPDPLGGVVRGQELGDLIRPGRRCTRSSGCATRRPCTRAGTTWRRWPARTRSRRYTARRWRWSGWTGCRPGSFSPSQGPPGSAFRSYEPRREVTAKLPGERFFAEDDHLHRLDRRPAVRRLLRGDLAVQHLVLPHRAVPRLSRVLAGAAAPAGRRGDAGLL